MDEDFHMQCRRKAAEFFAIAVMGKVQAEKHLQLISWQKSPAGWAKLNTDGSSCDNAGGEGAEEY